jgi:hypothetical protein
MYVRFLIIATLLLAGLSIAAPDDLESAFATLREAQTKNDPALLKKSAVAILDLAAKEKAEGDKERIDRVRDIQLNAEYALFTAAIQAQPATTVDLMSALETHCPKSKYLAEGYAAYFLALTRSGAGAKIPGIAEKAIANFPDNEDLLLVLADAALNRKQSDAALRYSKRLVAVMSSHSRPEGVSAADWERKRSASLGRGHWIAGLVHSEKNQYGEADDALRAALPFIQGNDAMLAAAYFYLGVANYQLGRQFGSRARVTEAAKFSDKAAQLKSPYAEQAWKNAHIMRTEALKMP